MKFCNTLFIGFFLSTLIFSSCEEPLILSVGDHESKIIVQGSFTDNLVLKVRVQRTNDPDGSEAHQTFIDFASVEVYHEETLIEKLKLDTFDAVYNGIAVTGPEYTTVNLIPEVGIYYTIVVKVPGYDEVRSTSFIPDKIPLENISFNNTIDDVGGGVNEVDFEINLEFDDPANENNYYHIIFIQEKTQYKISPSGDTIPVYSDLVQAGNFEVNPKYDNSAILKFSDDRSFLIHDDSFDGQKITIPFIGYIHYNSNQHLLEPFKVEFRTVTEDYYKFHKDIANNLSFGADPNSGPGIIHNNIKGGYGNFSGYSSTIIQFQIGD